MENYTWWFSKTIKLPEGKSTHRILIKSTFALRGSHFKVLHDWPLPSASSLALASWQLCRQSHMEHKVRSLESTSSSIWSANSLAYSQKLDHLPWLWPWRIPHDWPGILQKISPSLGPSQWTSSIISHQNNKHPANYSIHTLEFSQKTPGFWGPNKSQTWAAASPRGSSRQRSVDPGLKKESSQQTKESSTDRNNPNHGMFCGLFDIVFLVCGDISCLNGFLSCLYTVFSLNGFIWVLTMGIFWSILAEIGIKKWNVPNFLWALHVWNCVNLPKYCVYMGLHILSLSDYWINCIFLPFNVLGGSIKFIYQNMGGMWFITYRKIGL